MNTANLTSMIKQHSFFNRCEARLEKVRIEREQQAKEQPETKAKKRNKTNAEQDDQAPHKEPALKKAKLATTAKSKVPKETKKVPPKSATETTPAVTRPVVRQAPSDPALQARTVFISNLDFKVSEERIREVMSSSGTITDIRLVYDYKGRSKGYCYVEFAKEVCCFETITLVTH